MSKLTKNRVSWNNPIFRSFVYQALIVAVVAFAAWFLVSNTLHNLAARNITTGFDFLANEAGFAIGETAISYNPTDTYGRAIWAGLLNTLKVSLVGIVAATVLGTVLGVARLSKNGLASGVATAYIELMRNVPLLLQLFFWYALITESLPGPRGAINPLPGIFLSNRGMKFPAFQGESMPYVLAAIAVALVLIVILATWRSRRPERSTPFLHAGWWAIFLVVVLPAGAFWASGADLHVDVPQLTGFNFSGGYTLSPEFTALLVGLVFYTSAFVAEVVRSGIQAVNKGQWEAALALGLSRAYTLRLVILPQALRIIMPPMTSQYLNLVKNSSLAVAIGYPDIVSVVNTTLNQTGQAIEGILIIMAAYLTVSLSISVLMNWYNRRLALVER